MIANSGSWILYGSLLRDYYVYCSNIAGILLGVYFALTCYKFANEKAQDLIKRVMLIYFAFFIILGFVALAANFDFNSSKTLWGSTAVALLSIYYIAPLSTVAKVLSQRDSSSLHWPLCSMNIINGLLWFAYGLAIKDWFLILPNGIGAAFNVFCLALCLVLPAKERRRATSHPQHAGNGWSFKRLLSSRMSRPMLGAQLSKQLSLEHLPQAAAAAVSLTGQNSCMLPVLCSAGGIHARALKAHNLYAVVDGGLGHSNADSAAPATDALGEADQAYLIANSSTVGAPSAAGRQV
eukprot:GHRR01027535.1.p1 GENE.GHRR01027535.1~~GHRR01027535.1.p1  ORF type:complete len:294 (+),score=79.35 GHRR01027535.1:308-1189(+)